MFSHLVAADASRVARHHGRLYTGPTRDDDGRTAAPKTRRPFPTLGDALPAPLDGGVRGKTTSLRDYERDPEADAVPGLTRDRNSRSEGRRSMCSAIHITSRTWLRPSSTREPSDPPLRVVLR